VVGFDPEVIGDLPNWYRGGAGQELRQGAFVLGIEVLNKNESEPGVVRDMLEQLRECFEAPRGSAHANNRKSGG
jgi:hypothetical protein